METGSQDQPGNVAQVVALLVLPVAIYVAFWRIHWAGQDGSLIAYVLPVVFCIVVPSVAGSIAQGVVNVLRRD